MTHCLAAHTPADPEHYPPPYINISLGDFGEIVVTVRSGPKPDGSCGDAASISLPESTYRALVDEAQTNLFLADTSALQALRKAS